MNSQYKKIEAYLGERRTRQLIGFLLILGFGIFTFWLGMQVGYNKAAYNYQFADNYYETFGPHKISHEFGFIPDRDLNSHGISGKIMSINLPTIVVYDGDDVERVVKINPDTLIKRQQSILTVTDLKVGDFVVTIGAPNDSSQIEAKFIRLMPTPPAEQ